MSVRERVYTFVGLYSILRWCIRSIFLTISFKFFRQVQEKLPHKQHLLQLVHTRVPRCLPHENSHYIRVYHCVSTHVHMYVCIHSCSEFVCACVCICVSVCVCVRTVYLCLHVLNNLWLYRYVYEFSSVCLRTLVQ